MSESVPEQDIPTKRSPITVDVDLLARLTQSSETGSNVATVDSFYRYPEEFRKIEAHMRDHIRSRKGNYLVLDVGASTGKEPLSVIMSWEEMIREINPEYDGTVGVLAIE